LDEYLPSFELTREIDNTNSFALKTFVKNPNSISRSLARFFTDVKVENGKQTRRWFIKSGSYDEDAKIVRGTYSLLNILDQPNGDNLQKFILKNENSKDMTDFLDTLIRTDRIPMVPIFIIRNNNPNNLNSAKTTFLLTCNGIPLIIKNNKFAHLLMNGEINFDIMQTLSAKSDPELAEYTYKPKRGFMIQTGDILLTGCLQITLLIDSSSIVNGGSRVLKKRSSLSTKKQRSQRRPKDVCI
jgi:hypothetical protein